MASSVIWSLLPVYMRFDIEDVTSDWDYIIINTYYPSNAQILFPSILGTEPKIG